LKWIGIRKFTLLSARRAYRRQLPVKLTIDLPANVHRDLLSYAEALARETGQTIADPCRLAAPMLVRFMATDRAFKSRRDSQTTLAGKG
jgi:hypothetical protein